VRKLLTVFKSEYSQVVKKKSFLVGIFLTPLFMVVVTVLPALLADRGISTPEKVAIVDADGRGVGKEFAESLSQYKLDGDTLRNAYDVTDILDIDKSDIDQTRQKLDSMILAKQIKHYVVIFPRIDQSDSAMMVSKSMSFKTTGRFEWRISTILSKMRLEESKINIGVDSVMQMTRRIDLIQAAPGGKTKDFMTIYLSGLVFVLILFGSVMGFGSILMRSVIEEKNSRIMEVLVSSVSPFQLMIGKIAGLGAANLTQVGIWVAMGSLLFFYRGALEIPEGIGDIIFNPILLIFFVVFLILAYIMYSTIFAFIGSICSTDKETQNFIFPITMSLMLPIFILMYVVQEPDSLVTTVLSLIPIFTPTLMVLRINIIGPESFSLSDPIILEALLGVAITALFSLGVIWVTSRVFRMGILMTGKRATLPEIMKWIRYK